MVSLPRSLLHVLAFAVAGSLAPVVSAQAKLDAPPPLPAETPVTRIEAPDADVEHPLPPARITSPETRIVQRRQGNRVVEIIVTPAGSTRSYVIENREGMRPLSPHELSAGLSTPRFLRFDF